MAEIRMSESGRLPQPPAASRPVLRTLRTRDLVTELARKASQLARTEVQLAKVELRADLKREIATAGGLGVAGICALITVNLLLVAVAFAVAEAGVMAGWLASLILAAIVLGIGTVAGLVGWARRVRSPMEATRKTLKEDVQWARERVG